MKAALRCSLAFVTILSTQIFTTSSRADNAVTAITVSSPVPNDILVGERVYYQISYTGSDPVHSIDWYYTPVCFPGASQEVFWGSTASGINTQENRVGDFKVRAVATFRRYSGGTYTSQKTVTVSVNPPNKVDLDTACLNKPTPLLTSESQQPNLTCKFIIMRGDRKAYVMGNIMEKIMRSPYNKSPDRAWTAATYLTCTVPGEISDGKGMIIAPEEQANWNAVNPGYVGDELDQSLQIRLQTGCGEYFYYDLTPSFHFQFQKADNSNWKLIKPD